MEIIPGILEKEWSEIERKIEIVKPFAKTIQVDIIDGIFAPNTTFLDPTPFKKYANDLFFELHLMVENPIKYLKPFADVGFKRFVAQVEKMPDQVAFIAEAQILGEVGLALDGETPLDAIKAPFDDLDCFLLMTIKAGASGQTFNPAVTAKIQALRAKTNLPIEVDGGINDQTALLAQDAGANRFVSSSFLFNSKPEIANYKRLLNELEPKQTRS